MFFDKEDEEQDFMSPGGSKLGALFGMDKAENTGGNSSLTYTAPKQPKKKESTTPGKSGTAPSVAFAVAVNAYKYVDNNYASQGKLGAAILANHTNNEYSILMYVSQQQKVAIAKISSTFTFTTQANNYANFYDDSRQSWSVLFDNEQNAIDFAKHVALAKGLSTGSTPSSLVSQDLQAGEGGSLETGDSVEVKYTGWLLTNNTFGQVFDSNVSSEKLFRFKLNAGKVIKGWDVGVLGMKKNGRRFLVVPPAMAYGSQGMANRVPANATLLFQIEVVRVKLVGRDSSPSPAPPTSQTVATPTGGGDEDQEEDDHTVKGRTKSISDQLSHSPTQDTSKAKLISRMAKMGKPMLPLSGAVAAAPDSDDDHVPESPQPVMAAPVHHGTAVHKPVPKAVPQSVAPPTEPQQQQHAFTMVQNQAQPQPAFLQNLPGAQQMSVFQPQQTFLQQQQQQQQNMMQQGFQQQLYAGGVPTQPQQAVPGTSLPPYLVPGMAQGQDMMMMSETRQQNTEVRLSLSKVTDKVDQVLQKLDQAHSQNTGTSMLPNMETSVLLHNITRVIQENERLKRDVFEKSGKIESQNEKISELLQRNQSFVEKSQVLMEQRSEGLLTSSNQSQHKLLTLEQDKVQLTKDLTDAMSQISTLQLEVATYKKREFELTQQMDGSQKDTRRQSEELDSLKTQHKDDELLISDLQKQLREEKQSRKSLESNQSTLHEEMADLRAAKESLEKNLSERKRKAAEERRQLEDEVEDVKTNLEADIQSLKGKLRKQKTSSSAASQEQISQIEEEINTDWQNKCDKLLAVAAEKHARTLQSVKEEKEELAGKVQELENKIISIKSSSSGSDQRVSELQDQIEELAVWKDKYDAIRGNVASMKERYEERIREIEEERDAIEEVKGQLEEKIMRLEVEGKGHQNSGAGGSQNLLDEVKQIMNTVYKEMREIFEADESYTGTEILKVILNSIKSTTLALMKRQNEATKQEEEEESEEASDEEEEEEESDDDEEIEEPVVETADAKTEESVVLKQEVSDKPSESVEDDKNETELKTEQSGAVDNVDSDKDFIESDDDDDVGGEKDDVVKEKEVVETVTNGDKTEQENTGGGDAVVTIANEQTTDKAETVITNSNKSSDSNLKKAGSLEDLLDSALEKGGKGGNSVTATPLVGTEPPPLVDESSESEENELEKDRTKSIFNDDDDDDNVADTLGLTTKPVVNGDTEKIAADRQISNDEDLKPKPPPPLFGDDDDDDDLDWLS